MKNVVLLPLMVLLGACTDALVASRNLSKAADMFELERRIVFYNGITDAYILTIEGRCSMGPNASNTLSVTCKTGEAQYKKHHLGLSDNVTFFSEQLEASEVSEYQYRVVFKPKAIIPDVDLRIQE